MLRSFFKATAIALAAVFALPAQASVYTLSARVTMAPVVTGPSGYLAALPDAGSDAGEGHRFSIERLGGDIVALRVADGSYLSTGHTQWNYLSIDASRIDDNARFIMQRAGDQVSLRSVATGMYLGFNYGSGRLRAAYPERDANTVWVMQRVNPSTGAAESDQGFFNQQWPVQAFRDARGRWLSLSPAQASRLIIYPYRHAGGYRVHVETLCVVFPQQALNLQPPHIQFERFQTVEPLCSDTQPDLSQAFLQMLNRAVRFHVGQDRRLSLMDAQGVTIGVFQR